MKAIEKLKKALIEYENETGTDIKKIKIISRYGTVTKDQTDRTDDLEIQVNLTSKDY